MNRTVQGLVWCGLFLIAAEAFGQEITVVVRDAKNGHAVRDAEVWVQFFEPPANRKIQQIKSKTGADGVVHISLTAPQPPQVTVSASTHSFCLAYVTAGTVDLLQRGVADRCDPKPGDMQPTPEPGKVIFLVRKIPLWVRLIAPLETE